jgi:hypothetical protein
MVSKLSSKYRYQFQNSLPETLAVSKCLPYTYGMAKTNKEKLTERHGNQREMCAALGYAGVSDMLTRMTRAYLGGVPVTVHIGASGTSAIRPVAPAPDAQRTAGDTERA